MKLVLADWDFPYTLTLFLSGVEAVFFRTLNRQYLALAKLFSYLFFSQYCGLRLSWLLAL
jgi:hypothetical protein